MQDGYDFAGDITAPMITAYVITADNIDAMDIHTGYLFTDGIELGYDGKQFITIKGGVFFDPSIAVNQTLGAEGMLGTDGAGNLIFHDGASWMTVSVTSGTIEDGGFLNLEADGSLIVNQNATIYGSTDTYFLTVYENATVFGSTDTYFLTVAQNAEFQGDTKLGDDNMDLTFITGALQFASSGTLPALENGRLSLDSDGNLMFATANVWVPLVNNSMGDIRQGGNAFGSAVILGATDAHNLVFQAGNAFMTFTQDGRLELEKGMNNTLIGKNVGGNGNYNTFLGKNAGQSNSAGGDWNTFIGSNAGEGNTGGYMNTFIGQGAGVYSNNGFFNTFVGLGAGAFNADGAENVYVGLEAGRDNVGNGNIFLGNRAGRNLTTQNNALVIDNSDTFKPLIYGDFAADFVSINGNLAIGFSTATPPLGDGMLAFNTGYFYGYANGKWNQFATVRGGAGSEVILQGGNTFGTVIEIGTNDFHDVHLKINNTPVMRFITVGMTAGGTPHVVGGFAGNIAEINLVNQGSFIGGGGEAGKINRTTGDFGVVVGGKGNRAGSYSFVGGGENNAALQSYGFIGGGLDNTISSNNYQVIVGGQNNRIDAGASFNNFIGGGDGNLIQNGAQRSVIVGGQANVVAGTHSFAAGYQANIGIGHHGSFVWSDNLGNLATTAPQQFLARASGGFQFYTEPTNNLAKGVFISANSGNLGVGVRHPVTKLHIKSNIPSTTTGIGSALSHEHLALFENTNTGNAHGIAIKLNNSMPTDENHYLTFYKDNSIAGAIEGLGGNVVLVSGSADYAEWLFKQNLEENFEKGEIVGLRDGKITKNLENASQIKVISTAPIVLGNAKFGQENQMEKVAFLGQVPVKIWGKVRAGDLIIPSGKNDGTGIAVSESEITAQQYPQIVGTAWESSENEGLKTVNVSVGQNTPEVKISELMQQTENQASEIHNLKTENQKLKTDFGQMQQKLEAQQAQIDQLLKLLTNSQKPENQSFSDDK